MDTPGHVSGRERQEADENRWGVFEVRDREEKGVPSKGYQCNKKRERKGQKGEQKEERVLESQRTYCTALHGTYGIHA